MNCCGKIGCLLLFAALRSFNLADAQCNPKSTRAIKAGPNGGFISSFIQTEQQSIDEDDDTRCWLIFSHFPLRLVFTALDVPCGNGSYVLTEPVGFIAQGVTIFDGKTTNEPIIGAVCNSTLNYRFYFTRGDALIVYHNNNDNSSPSSGFSLRYEIAEKMPSSGAIAYNDDTPCQETFTIHQSRGTLQNYRKSSNGKYRPHENCTWIMHGRIVLAINYLDLEKGGPLCVNDSLLIEELTPRLNDRPFIDVLCDQNLLRFKWYVFTGAILVTFQTNGAIERRGFSINFDIKPLSSPRRLIGQILPCGGTYNLTDRINTISSFKQLKSRKFGNSYGVRERCQFTILSKNSTFYFRFRQLALADERDLIAAFNGESPSSSNNVAYLKGPLQIASYSRPSPWFRSDGTLQLFIHTDLEYDNTGFVMEYTSELLPSRPEVVEDGELPCRSIITIDIDANPTGCIRSGRSKRIGTYRPNENCHWQLISSYQLRLIINRFQLEAPDSDKKCGHDSLSIFSSHEGEATEFVREMCGILPNLPVEEVIPSFANGNNARFRGHHSSNASKPYYVTHITFRTDASLQYSGFSLCYEQILPGNSPIAEALMEEPHKNSAACFSSSKNVAYYFLIVFLMLFIIEKAIE